VDSSEDRILRATEMDHCCCYYYLIPPVVKIPEVKKQLKLEWLRVGVVLRCKSLVEQNQIKALNQHSTHWNVGT